MGEYILFKIEGGIMKKLLLGLCLLSTVALSNTVKVTLPYDTLEVVSSEYDI